tara:strand:+ start:61 stop:1302 length:1242 start_codon:yes stop_codon:yes gene_type:complete
MATFEAQVEALTSLDIDGSSAPTQSELSQFLTDGAKEILNTLPRSKQALFTTANDLNGSSQSLTLLGSEIFSVTRDDGTINQPCRRVPAELNGRIRDSDDMMAATTTDPAYYVTNNILVVVPSPTNAQNAHVHTLNYPTVAFGDSTIAKFPDDAEYLVPIYGAIKSLSNKLSTLIKSDLSISASAPSAPSLATLSYSNASNADANATSVSSVTVSTVDKADISGDVPTYSKPSTTVNFGSGNNFDTLLGTDEDTELASVELQKQNQLLDAHRADIQNELNEFNKENVRYQANVQAELAKHNTDLQVAQRQAQIDAADAQQEASQATDVDKFNKSQDQALDLQNKAQTLQAAIQNNDDLVSKFLAELNKYSALVNTEVQTYSQNLENNQRNYNIYSQQQAKLQADYDKGIQALK